MKEKIFGLFRYHIGAIPTMQLKSVQIGADSLNNKQDLWEYKALSEITQSIILNNKIIKDSAEVSTYELWREILCNTG